MRQQVTELRAQRAEYSQIIVDHLVHPKFDDDFDEEVVLAQIRSGNLQSMEDLLQELEEEENHRKRKSPRRK